MSILSDQYHKNPLDDRYQTLYTDFVYRYPKEKMTLIDFKVTVSNIKFKIPGTSSGQASVFSFIVLEPFTGQTYNLFHRYLSYIQHLLKFQVLSEQNLVNYLHYLQFTLNLVHRYPQRGR